MGMKGKTFFLAFFFVLIVFYLTCGSPEVPSNISNKERLKYKKIFEETLPGEEKLHEGYNIHKILVRAFDLKHTNGKNGIVVAGKKLYIFSANGTLLYKSFEDFKWDLQQIRIAKLSKDGYKDAIIISQHTCGPTFEVFDRFGVHLSTISNLDDQNLITFFIRDLNGDGIDEFITCGKAFYTLDGGLTWKKLWENDELISRWIEENDELSLAGLNLGSDFGNEGGFAARYCDYVLAVNGAGKVLFKTKIPDSRPVHNWNYSAASFATGEFTGNGIKNGIVALGGSDYSKIYILDKTGRVNDIVSLEIRNSARSLFAKKVITGQLISDSNADEIVAVGNQGILAYDAQGNKLWEYIITSNGAAHMFISDLYSDGKSELIAGMDNKILILSNQGELIDELRVEGNMKGASWGSDNPAMDIADINNDGYQEIIAVTTEGKLYVFGIVEIQNAGHRK